MNTRRKPDHHTRHAQREGYPARSIYKLQEIDRRVGLFKRGQHVLDLGASPGSWTLYAAQQVGSHGRVLGIDLQDPAVALPSHAEFRTLDVFDVDPRTLGGPFDVVMSDMAPHTTGQRHADHYRSYRLVMRTLELTQTVLIPGGVLVAKLLQGAEFKEVHNALRSAFSKAQVIRPKVTRKSSSELFFVGLRFKSNVPA